jgi:hypothetical protein
MTLPTTSETAAPSPEERTAVQRLVLDAVYAKHHTVPYIHGHVERALRKDSSQAPLLAAAYLAHTGSSQATTRKAVYQLLDLGVLSRDGERVVLA